MTKPILEVFKKDWDVSVEKRLNSLTAFRKNLEGNDITLYNTINYNTYNTYLGGQPGEPPTWVAMFSAIEFIIDGGGAVITTGEKGHIEIPFDSTITQVALLADRSGSIVVDIWKDTYGNFAPVDADSITASAPPTITTAQKSQDKTLTGWTKAIAAGDILAFNVDSCTTITRVTVALTVRK